MTPMASSRNEVIRAAMAFLGGPIIRLMIIAIFLVLSLYLGYLNAYAPLFDDVQLPAAVQAQSARINMNALDAIDSATTKRVNHTPNVYGQYRALFAPSSNE